jgi:dipeptidyl aminopeptidase/acylaminoacyl peptidase
MTTRLRGVVVSGIALCVAAAFAGRPLAAPDAQAQASRGRALALEDYYRVLSVGGVAISPDARWVLYDVSRRVESDNGTETDAFYVSTSGTAEPVPIRHDGARVTGTAWQPDGRVRYTAGGQVWTIDPANPSAAPVRLQGSGPAGGREGTGGRGGRGGGRGGGGAVASPDGAWTVVLRDGPEPARAAPALSEFEQRHEARFEGARFDWMQFQRDGQPFPAPDPTAGPARHVVLRGRDGVERVILDDDLRPSNVAWHPGSRTFAFTADVEWRNERSYGRSDMWTATTDGTATRLTDDLYQYGNLGFSPDGRYLSYRRTFGTDMVIGEQLDHGGPNDLFVRHVAEGHTVNLTEDWDLEPGTPMWSPDSRFIYYTAAVGGESHLFRVTVPGGVVEQVTRGPRRIGNLSIDPTFTTMAYTVGLHEAPPDVYTASIDGRSERRLTDVHREFVAEVALNRADALQWPSRDGTTIEGWLMYPHGYDPARGPYPLIVFSHGGPHSATGYSFDFKKQYFAANGYFVFDTNFRSSTGYGEAFKWATWGAWGDKDGEDVMSGIDYVIERYPIDRARVGHTGHSYGGFMTNWLITQYPDRFAAAVSGAGISNWISDYGTADIFRTKETEFYGPPWDEAARNRMIRQSPLTYADRVRTPTLFVHGEVDQRVPYEEAEQMYFALKRRGVPAMMIQYKDMPHGIRGHWNNVHRMMNELRWWETYLK